MAHAAALACEPFEQIEEHFFGLCFVGDFIEVGDTGFGKEQAVAVSQNDAVGFSAVLVLFENQFAQIIIRLLARFSLDAFEIKPCANSVVPLRSAGQSAVCIDASQAWMADK